MFYKEAMFTMQHDAYYKLITDTKGERHGAGNQWELYGCC